MKLSIFNRTEARQLSQNYIRVLNAKGNPATTIQAVARFVSDSNPRVYFYAAAVSHATAKTGTQVLGIIGGDGRPPRLTYIPLVQLVGAFFRYDYVPPEGFTLAAQLEVLQTVYLAVVDKPDTYEAA